MRILTRLLVLLFAVALVLAFTPGMAEAKAPAKSPASSKEVAKPPAKSKTQDASKPAQKASAKPAKDPTEKASSKVQKISPKTKKAIKAGAGSLGDALVLKDVYDDARQGDGKALMCDLVGLAPKLDVTPACVRVGVMAATPFVEAPPLAFGVGVVTAGGCIVLASELLDKACHAVLDQVAPSDHDPTVAIRNA